MKNNLYENKTLQNVFTAVVVLVIIVGVLFYNKIKIEEQYLEYQKNILINQYFVYKKLYFINNIKHDFDINNPNYIDKTKMVDEFAMSTPFIIDKTKKLLPEKLITFRYLQENLSKQEDTKSYIIKIDEKKNKMFLKGMLTQDEIVEIEYNLSEYNDLGARISNLFVNSWIAIAIVLLLFMYAIFIIKSFLVAQVELKNKFLSKEKEIEKIAFVDTLTGASSRLKFNIILEDMIHVGKRFNKKFSLVMLDIDHFKSFNDKYGHDIGDFILQEVSKNIKFMIRETDTFARWGGEEFMIILPYTEIDQAIVFTKKVQNAINSMEFTNLPSVSCSFGVVEYIEDDDKENIIKRVDKMLYLAKNSGRNCIKF
ncbi:MAG: GGDEF domain-containing protein [Arcobacteraceae bacterium]|nr:GGDEF domain-containing protein [Arcobacteraceae bacterium]